MSKMYFLPFRPAFDSAGITVPGSQHYFTLAGTNTPSAPFTDAALTSPHANPVIANGIGYLDPIYLDPAISYRVRIYDADAEVGVADPLEEYDPYVPALANTDILADLASVDGANLVNTTFSAPAFTNSAFTSSAQYLTGGATPDAWYTAAFAGNKAAEGFTSGIIVPATATNLQTNAIAAYIRADRAQVGGGGDVALFSLALSNENNAAAFTFNFVGIDAAGKTGQTLQGEIDYNARGDTDVNGVVVTIVSADGNPLTGSRIAFNANAAFDADSQWNIGYQTTDGAISQYAIFVGAVSTTTLTNRDSQPIAFVSYKNDNTRYIATIIGDHLGGIAIRAGVAGGSIAFQDPTGATNWASVNANGLGYTTGVGGAVTQATSKSTGVTLNKACGQITMNAAALAAGAKVSFVVTNSLVAATDILSVNVVSGGTANAYRAAVTAVGAGTFTVTVENITAGSLSEAPVIGFAKFNAVAA
jgi:hypothetical protein